MRHIARLALPVAIAFAFATSACSTSHSVKAPSKSSNRVDLGPILDSYGVDIAPFLASRMTELRLADARVVLKRDPAVPYVTGNVAISREEAEGRSEWLPYFGIFIFPLFIYGAQNPGSLEATVDARLTKQIGQSGAVAFEVKDEMHLRYDSTSQAGTQTLDGIASGIAAGVH